MNRNFTELDKKQINELKTINPTKIDKELLYSNIGIDSPKKEKMDLNIQVQKFHDKTGTDFTKFYNKYLPKLQFFATKYCGDEEEALDYANESIISSLEKIDTYDAERAGFSTWLFTIARNHVFQMIKKKKRLPLVSIDTTINEEGATLKEFISDSSLDDNIKKEEEDLYKLKSEIMHEKIKELKPSYREIITMREINNMSYKDIADTLGKEITLNIVAEANTKIRLPKYLSEVFKIENVSGKNKPVYELFESSSIITPFLTHISFVEKGEYNIHGTVPENLSTVKSRIRNARIKLQKLVKNEYEYLDIIYK